MIAEMLIISLNPVDALIGNVFRRFPQGFIEKNSWITRLNLDPHRFGWLECCHRAASERGPS